MKIQLIRRVLYPFVAAIVLFLGLNVLVASAPPELPRQSAGYDLSWWTVDGGGGRVTDGSSGYALAGTASQPDASLQTSGAYGLKSGFWGGVALERWYEIRLLLIFKDNTW